MLSHQYRRRVVGPLTVRCVFNFSHRPRYGHRHPVREIGLSAAGDSQSLQAIVWTRKPSVHVRTLILLFAFFFAGMYARTCRIFGEQSLKQSTGEKECNEEQTTAALA